MVQLAIFASGTGTNAGAIISRFRDHPGIRVALVVSNKAGAPVLDLARSHGIPALVLEKDRFANGDAYVEPLLDFPVDFIVLAGFLLKIPPALIRAFPNRIINLHPALLPKYGGKGMYGHFVHDAVIAAGEKESGISIHYVDEWYDHGNIIYQARCPVDGQDTPLTLARKIQQLEHTHYPEVIEKTLEMLKK
jgi:phosphoribosylglycinamide formyltransferase-1